jgi:hypothetical protein
MTPTSGERSSGVITAVVIAECRESEEDISKEGKLVVWENRVTGFS